MCRCAAPLGSLPAPRAHIILEAAPNSAALQLRRPSEQAAKVAFEQLKGCVWLLVEEAGREKPFLFRRTVRDLDKGDAAGLFQAYGSIGNFFAVHAAKLKRGEVAEVTVDSSQVAAKGEAHGTLMWLVEPPLEA
jgi:hypothetical protein